ncbi:MAG TPA: 3'-5' exonuclease [Firmicutes bacterium]|nr:3'-5' exonuclease [Bacillota bacterium]
MNRIIDLKKNVGQFKTNLLVKNCVGGVANNSKPYLNIVFQDATGIMDGKKWEVLPEDEKILTPGLVVEVDGTVLSYRGNMQIKVNSVKSIDQKSINMTDFVHTCPIEHEALLNELDSDLNLIEDKDIKAITEHIIKNNYEKYTTHPAAVSVHHAFYGGILFHSLSMCRQALKISEQYPFLNRDYLIAGCLLHDIGKTVELNGNIATSFTDEGKLLGHINIGAMIVDEAANELNITGEAPLILKHIILSHHGLPEYGSAVLPKTAEAFVIHALDELDSKLNILETALNEVEKGKYTSKIIYLDNRQFYKTK